MFYGRRLYDNLVEVQGLGEQINSKLTLVTVRRIRALSRDRSGVFFISQDGGQVMRIGEISWKL